MPAAAESHCLVDALVDAAHEQDKVSSALWIIYRNMLVVLAGTSLVDLLGPSDPRAEGFGKCKWKPLFCGAVQLRYGEHRAASFS